MFSISSLPIDEVLPALRQPLDSHFSAILVAPPGAGKTTRVPPFVSQFLEASKSSHRGVIMLQPRRVAARAAAARIASEQGWRLGEEVGYQVRFENRTGPRTRIRVMTEGILARRIQHDPFLEGIGCVLLDEFHERSIHTDLAIALLREIQTTVRDDLRLIVMSATLNPGPVSEFLDNAPVIESRGRLFLVEVDYLHRADNDHVAVKAAGALERVLSGTSMEETGHVLVFLPGIGEIRRVESSLDLRAIDSDIHILHSSVSGDDQDRALRPSARRKVVLATNIAETSITIDGVRTVIDSGVARIPVHDPRLGIDRLELRRISRASASQRAGRAGRTAPGRCLRLWTRTEDAALEEFELAEVHRIDLASTILSLKAYGVRDVRAFNWFESPRGESIDRAMRLLWMLGALDKDENLTALGAKLASLPLHPRIGRLLVDGVKQGLVREAATIAALLTERDILSAPFEARRREAKWSSDSDILDRLEMFEEGARGQLDPAAVRGVERVRDSLIQEARRLQSATESDADD